ncbi:hypothetical protein F5Y12DRAFT_719781 [Xylaria sp. FL1777]|nr:hypothetical protein F5Y12DRAFT_719781 [Xylaria sp. FL1777]
MPMPSSPPNDSKPPRHASILYPHIIRRPLSRALPRIPRRSSTWSCDNLAVGRGANTPFSFISTVAAAPGSVWPSCDSSLLSPRSRRLATRPFQVRSTTQTASSRSAPKISPAGETSFIETDETHEASETDAVQAKEVEARIAVAEAVETGKNTQNGETNDSTETTHLGNIAQGTETLVQRDISALLERSPEQVDSGDQDSPVPLSNQIHIVGFNVQARFLAYALASTPGVHVNILVHHSIVMSRWGIENRELSLYNDIGRYVSSTKIPCPEPILDPSRQYVEAPKDSDFLDNVIIDTTTGAVLPTLEELSYRIDRHTTICLLHPGLGLVEKINEVVFPDPLKRPNFILCHSTYKVSKVSDTLYSLRQRQSGKLYLYRVPRFEDSTLANSRMAHEGTRKSTHLIELLSSTETLSVVGLPQDRFLTWKLPWLIFSSAADSVCVMLGCKYKQISPNRDARAMFDNLLDECVTIVSQFPELQGIPHGAEYFTRPSFRRKMRTYLVAQGTNSSPWVKHVRLGTELPIGYFNGYLVQRAKELQLDHKYNSIAMATVNARVNARRWELRWDMRGTTQYMGDTDTIGNGQPVPDINILDPDFDLL